MTEPTKNDAFEKGLGLGYSELDAELVAAVRAFVADAEKKGQSPAAIVDAIHFHLTLLLSHRAQFKLHAVANGRVLSGPFAGMRMPPPKPIKTLRHLLPVDGGSFDVSGFLLGTYESELHGAIESLLARSSYEMVVDLGCSIGYYAVGLAMRQPGTVVHARDTHAAALSYVQEMARLNGVADRVRTGGLWAVRDFEALPACPCLLFCDIEGGELELLDPLRVRMLARCDIIVELHDFFLPSISKTVIERFATTHDISVIRNGSHRAPLPREIDVLTRHEAAAVLTDLRLGPTPWAVMTSRERAARS